MARFILKKIANPELRITNLENIITSSTQMTATTTDGVISQGFNWILEQFKNIGITIADEIIQARQFVADVITSREIATEYLQVKEHLVVGSKEKPVGITIFDRLTGEPVCVYVEKGKVESVAGECGAEALSGAGSSSGDVNALELPNNPSVPTIPEATTTPETAPATETAPAPGY